MNSQVDYKLLLRKYMIVTATGGNMIHVGSAANLLSITYGNLTLEEITELKKLTQENIETLRNAKNKL